MSSAKNKKKTLTQIHWIVTNSVGETSHWLIQVNTKIVAWVRKVPMLAEVASKANVTDTYP